MIHTRTIFDAEAVGTDSGGASIAYRDLRLQCTLKTLSIFSPVEDIYRSLDNHAEPLQPLFRSPNART